MSIPTSLRTAIVSTRLSDLPVIKRDRVRRIQYFWADLSRDVPPTSEWRGRASLSIHLLSEGHDENPATGDRVIILDGTECLGLGEIKRLGAERELPANAGFLRAATMRLQPWRYAFWEAATWSAAAREELRMRQRALDHAGLVQAQETGLRVGTFVRNSKLAQDIFLATMMDFVL